MRLRTCTEELAAGPEGEDSCCLRGGGGAAAGALVPLVLLSAVVREEAPLVRSLWGCGIERSFPLISARVVRISLRFTVITSSTFKKGDYTRLPKRVRNSSSV